MAELNQPITASASSISRSPSASTSKGTSDTSGATSRSQSSSAGVPAVTSTLRGGRQLGWSRIGRLPD
jgi:hypothetical protein